MKYLTGKPLISLVYNRPGDSDSFSWAPESENDTLDCVNEICQVLTNGGYRVNLVPIGRNDMKQIKKIQSGVIFNLIEWTGRDMRYLKKAMSIIEKIGIPYTGCDFDGLFLSTNKVLMKKEFTRLGIPTPDYRIVESKSDLDLSGLKYPVIIKPAYEHCGIGITEKSVSWDETDLKAKVCKHLDLYKQPVLIEEYIDGREIQVTVTESRGETMAMSPIEVIFFPEKGKLPIYSYDTKWNDKSMQFMNIRVELARLPQSVRTWMETVSCRVYDHLGGRDYSRLDMRLRGNELFVLEINNNPNIDFTEIGGLRKSAEAMNMDYLSFLKHLINNASYRFGLLGRRESINV